MNMVEPVEAILWCEKCRGPRRHSSDGEYRAGPSTWPQMFKCWTCKLVRRFGLTTTPMKRHRGAA